MHIGLTLQDCPGLPCKMSVDYFAYLSIFKQLIIAYYINQSFEIRFYIGI